MNVRTCNISKMPSWNKNFQELIQYLFCLLEYKIQNKERKIRNHAFQMKECLSCHNKLQKEKFTASKVNKITCKKKKDINRIMNNDSKGNAREQV